MTLTAGVDWTSWTVILLKPDCLARNLVEPVLGWVGRQVQVCAMRIVEPTQEQVFAHYDDVLELSGRLGVDVPAELRRIYIGQQVAVALGYGAQAAARLRVMIGHTDPAAAGPHTIRGYFGTDSLRAARGRGQLVNNLIHTSDTAAVVARDFDIWYGPAYAHLLTTPPDPARAALPAPDIADRPGRTP